MGRSDCLDLVVFRPRDGTASGLLYKVSRSPCRESRLRGEPWTCWLLGRVRQRPGCRIPFRDLPGLPGSLERRRRAPTTATFRSPAPECLCHQLPDFGAVQRDETTFFVLVELRAKIERVYSRIVSIQNKEALRLTEEPSLCHELPVLRREGDSELVAFLADDGGRLQKNQPVLCVRVVFVDGNESSVLFAEYAHEPQTTIT
jgi:hypothetical protein